MASYFSRYGRLSDQTMNAWRRFHTGQGSIEQRRNFYLTYLSDVVPDGVAVHHIPSNRQPWDLNGTREEIQLYYAGKVFMTGVIGLDRSAGNAEEIASTLAFTHWRSHHFVPYYHQAWGMFTGLERIRFCSSPDGREWGRTEDVDPYYQVHVVVAYFRQEFERIRRH